MVGKDRMTIIWTNFSVDKPTEENQIHAMSRFLTLNILLSICEVHSNTPLLTFLEFGRNSR